MRLLLLLSFSRSLFRFFRRMGVFGLFLMSALDSSFLVLPFGNDLLLIAMVSSNRQGWEWIAYVLVSAIGSVVGVFVIDLLMREISMFRDGEMAIQQGGNGLTQMVNRFGQELAQLARIDFERSETLAGRFQFPEARIMTRLAIVQGTIGARRPGPRGTAENVIIRQD